MRKSVDSSPHPDRGTLTEPSLVHPPATGAPPLDAGASEARIDDVGDARLVERARSGDDRAFAALVARYERKLIRVLARLVRDEELARDLAQETFWKVYNRLDRFDTARRFGPWLFRVGVNLGLDQLRRREGPPAASIDRPTGEEHRAYELSDPDPRIQAELAQEVHFLLERIPVPYRTILVLRDLEGFSSAEVAAIVGRREATVRWRLAKARDLFREHWGRRQETTRREAKA
ncbi:MAG TPA: sigma-70 family RNA polymerase sigma factor [Isosphaeraceae bacterium]|nr:sigma-70 family RNA polymerase sigma factor [Isosphaeraceae bacterium]